MRDPAELAAATGELQDFVAHAPWYRVAVTAWERITTRRNEMFYPAFTRGHELKLFGARQLVEWRSHPIGVTHPIEDAIANHTLAGHFVDNFTPVMFKLKSVALNKLSRNLVSCSFPTVCEYIPQHRGFVNVGHFHFLWVKDEVF